MIAERVEEARDLRARDVEKDRQQGDEAERSAERPFGVVPHAVRARELLDRLVAQFADVAADGQARELARQRRERRIIRLRAQLEDIDELRAEPRVPCFERPRHVLERIAPAKGQPPAPGPTGEHEQHQGDVHPESRATGEVHHHVQHQRRRQKSHHPQPAPQQQTRASFLLQNAIRRAETRREWTQRLETRLGLGRGNGCGRAHGRKHTALPHRGKPRHPLARWSWRNCWFSSSASFC